MLKTFPWSFLECESTCFYGKVISKSLNLIRYNPLIHHGKPPLLQEDASVHHNQLHIPVSGAVDQG